MRITIRILFIVLISSCKNGNDGSDAYGNFEASDIIVSSEANGKLLKLDIDEGMQVMAGQRLGLVDTTQLHFKKQQMICSIAALKSKLQDVKVQIDVLLEQKQNLTRERDRLTKLYKDNAATQKQLDDINGEIQVVDSRIIATKTQMNSSNTGLLSEIAPLEAQIEQIDDQLSKSYIAAPVSGTILSKYAEKGEIVSFGKPLFKIADLTEMELRVYVSGDQLASIKLGQSVNVLVDKDRETNRGMSGKVTWISSQAEFTPKIIQTKEERVNLVYAMKVTTSNDGTLKIGMPGEVNFTSTDSE